MPKENGEAKGQGGPNTHAFFVDQPQGTLPARQVDGSVCDTNGRLGMLMAGTKLEESRDIGEECRGQRMTQPSQFVAGHLQL